MRCGAPLQQALSGPSPAPAPAYGQAPLAGAGPGAMSLPAHYAGFWIRFLAALLDGVLVGIVSLVIFVPIGIAIGLAGVAGAASDRRVAPTR